MNLEDKVIILLSVSVLLIGCSSKEVNLYTIDMDRLELIATMELPMEFDTMYSWFHLSDNDGNDLYKYRISKRDFVYLEKGWFWDEPQNQYQVTLSHNRPEMHFKGQFGNEETMALILENMRFEYPKTELQEQGELEIDNRNIIYYVYSRGIEKGKEIGSELDAYLEIGGRLLNIEFKCKNDDCNEFGKRMIPSLRTLRIKEKS